jgi:hypothetical protein
MKYAFYIVCLLVVLVACKKDKFDTKPSLQLKSTSSKVIPPNGNLNLKFDVTDKEGDLVDTLYITRKRLNIRTVTRLLADTFNLNFPPSAPDFKKGELDVTLFNTELYYAEQPLNNPSSPTGKESDSMTYYFVIKDKAGHKSDTVSVTPVVAQRN